MEPITIEEALEIRERLKKQVIDDTCPPEEFRVICNILGGHYDRLENPLQVAKDDVAFTLAYAKGEE